MSPVNAILLNVSHSSDALKQLYQLRKSTDRTFTMAYICKRARVSSTGYLADVFSGRRVLNKKYRNAVSRLFLLNHVERRYLRILIDLDNANKQVERKKLQRRLLSTRKALEVTKATASGSLREFMFAIEVFCTFGLFKNSPTRQDLINFFGSNRSGDLDRAIESLKNQKLIDEHEGRLHLLTHQISFAEDANGGITHIDFLKMCLSHAAETVADWFPQKDLSYLHSSFISVSEASYRSILPSLKTKFMLMQSDLETGDGDMLVRFNVQLYPAQTKNGNRSH